MTPRTMPSFLIRLLSPRVRRVTSIGAAFSMLAAGGCVSLASYTPPRPSPGDSALASQQLQESLQEYWRDVLPRRPGLALDAGFLVNGFVDLDHESARRDGRKARELAQMLDAINVDALPPASYLDWLTLQWETNARAEARLFHWSDFSDISPTETPLREMLHFLDRHPLDSKPALERYLYLLEVFSFELGRVREALEERRGRGYVASKDAVRSSITFLRALRALDDRGPWSGDSTQLTAVDSAAARAFSEERKLVVMGRLLPSLDSLAAWLEQGYLATALTRPGLWQYPGGKEHYRHLLRRKASIEITPEQAHGVGLASLRRIDSLMAAVRVRMGVRGTAEAFHDSLRRTLPSVDDSGLVARARELQRRLAPRIAERVLVDTHPSPRVGWGEAWQAIHEPDGGWRRGDGGGQLLLSPRWRTASARFSVAGRVAALGAPGRALQRQVVLTNDSLTPLRKLIESRAFVEGWGAYAAALAGELGMYDEPLAAYGRLMDEGFAAALLVVDTGVHYLGWTRQQGLAVLRRYSLDDDALLESIFVQRIVDDPGGGGVATLAVREIAAQRAWVERELGPAFDRRAWHRAMLREGALPLPIAATHMEQWLYEVRRARAAAADSARRAVTPKKPGADS